MGDLHKLQKTRPFVNLDKNVIELALKRQKASKNAKMFYKIFYNNSVKTLCAFLKHKNIEKEMKYLTLIEWDALLSEFYPSIRKMNGNN